MLPVGQVLESGDDDVEVVTALRRAAEVVARPGPPGVALAGLVAGVELRRVDQLARGQLGDVPLRVVDVRTGEPRRACRPRVDPVDGVGVLLGVRPVVDVGLTGLEHLGHDPAELLAREHVHVLRLVGRHQVPVAVGLAVPGGVEVGQAERVAVLVGDHARLVDRGLGVDVVGADPDEHLVVGGRGGLLRVRRVRPVERPALEVLELVVRGEAGQAGHRVGVVGLQRRGVRPDVVVGGVGEAQPAGPSCDAPLPPQPAKTTMKKSTTPSLSVS